MKMSMVGSRRPKLWATLWLLSLPCLAQAASVATLLDLAGRCEITAPETPCVLLAPLTERNMLRLEQGAQATLVLHASGEEVRLKGGDAIRVTAQGIEVLKGSPEVSDKAKKLMAAALLKGDLDVRAKLGGLVLRGTAVTRLPLRLVSPVDTRLLSAPTTLQWQHCGPAAGRMASVRLSTADGELLWSAENLPTSARLPSSLPLKPATTYQWTVSLPAIPQQAAQSLSAVFEIANSKELQTLAALEPSPAEGIASQIAFALALQNQGFSADAGLVLARLVDQHPQFKAQLLSGSANDCEN